MPCHSFGYRPLLVHALITVYHFLIGDEGKYTHCTQSDRLVLSLPHHLSALDRYVLHTGALPNVWALAVNLFSAPRSCAISWTLTLYCVVDRRVSVPDRESLLHQARAGDKLTLSLRAGRCWPTVAVAPEVSIDALTTPFDGIIADRSRTVALLEVELHTSMARLLGSMWERNMAQPAKSRWRFCQGFHRCPVYVD